MEDLWRAVFPVGIEDAFEENGVLHGNKVYLFSYRGIVSPFPPSDKIGINLVQKEAEEILPMKKMKMDWVPYIPLAYSMDLDFKLGPATSISVQSTSVADQFVTSEAKDNFPLTASPCGDSIESNGRPGAGLVRDTNTTDNLLLLMVKMIICRGERNSKPCSRSNIAQSEQVSRMDGYRNVRSRRHGMLCGFVVKNQAYAFGEIGQDLAVIVLVDAPSILLRRNGSSVLLSRPHLGVPAGAGAMDLLGASSSLYGLADACLLCFAAMDFFGAFL
ncbi:hypothetical protein IFM89_013451 [Coptis chinensis]|uniref:Uncharacterized protein n=1 Tax=Coptis chinensis TaxID=261450 RepID=A0A835HK89_9MAGN|nr:hypothetical protein IFM89_013451 [Coptis chinensis]